MASTSASDRLRRRSISAVSAIAVLLAIGALDGCTADGGPGDARSTVPVLVPGETVPPGVARRVEIGTHCGVAVLGARINEVTWIADEAAGATDWLPDEWAAALAPGRELLEVEVELAEDGGELRATAADRTVVYRPAGPSDVVPGCA